MEAPTTRYTQTPDGVDIAYSVAGQGPVDVLCIPGFVSNLEVLWEAPGAERYFGRLASFARIIMYDKRGQGLSDRPARPPTLEQAMEDARAVLDAAGMPTARPSSRSPKAVPRPPSWPPRTPSASRGS